MSMKNGFFKKKDAMFYLKAGDWSGFLNEVYEAGLSKPEVTSAFYHCARNNMWDKFKHIHDNMFEVKNNSDYYIPVRVIAETDNVEMMKWVFERCKLDNPYAVSLGLALNAYAFEIADYCIDMVNHKKMVLSGSRLKEFAECAVLGNQPELLKKLLVHNVTGKDRGAILQLAKKSKNMNILDIVVKSATCMKFNEEIIYLGSELGRVDWLKPRITISTKSYVVKKANEIAEKNNQASVLEFLQKYKSDVSAVACVKSAEYVINRQKKLDSKFIKSFNCDEFFEALEIMKKNGVTKDAVEYCGYMANLNGDEYKIKYMRKLKKATNNFAAKELKYYNLIKLRKNQKVI